MYAGADDAGALLAIDVDRSVRLVSAPPAGTAQVLLDETTYQHSWAFDPTSVVALRRSDGVDVLVSDDSSVVLVRRQGSAVSVTTLATSNNSDLSAMALAAGSAGTLAVFGRGKDTVAAPEAVTAVDVDPLLAMVNPSPSIAQQIAQMPQASRTFTPPAGPVAVAAPGQIWLTTERLDQTTDCQDTGQTAACTGGKPAVAWLDCTWHVDAFKLTKGADLQAAAVATVAGRAFLHGACGSTTPVSPGDIIGNLGLGWGMSNHHAAGVDLATSQLGLVLNYQPAQTMSGLQFALIAALGGKSIDGVTTLFPTAFTTTNSFAWIRPRSGHVFYCSGDSPSTCWSADASAATMANLDVGVARGTVLLADGIGVVEPMDNPDTSAWLQPLPCTH